MGTHYKGCEEEKRALNAFIKLMRAAESVNSRLNVYINQAGLTPSQFNVLEALYHLGPMNQSELCGKLLKSGGNITMVIDNLEKRELVERKRSPEDRRFISVHLTPAGRKIISEIFPDHVKNILSEFSPLDSDEQEELSRMCKKIGRGSEEEER